MMQYTSAEVLANVYHQQEKGDRSTNFPNRDRSFSLDLERQRGVNPGPYFQGVSQISSDSSVSNGHSQQGIAMDGGSDRHSDVGSPCHQDHYIDFSTQLKSITLTWTDVSAGVDRGQETSVTSCLNRCSQGFKAYHKIGNNHVRILKEVSGVAFPGRVLAIMGASGAGKTTLLNVLTNRHLGNLIIGGDVRVNGDVIGSRIRKIAAYVQQEYLFIGMLKVREHLMFHANLRLGKALSERERIERVEQVLSELGLNKCRNTIIGGTRMKRRGISGGERKRLAFATEILTNPGMLFCDEPTSGLDSFTALQTVEVLKTMASQGKTIICTIHQPSSQVFEQFDDLCLLANGRIAYIGPAKEAKHFFDAQSYPCPPKFNPADHYIRILAITPKKEKQCKQRIKKICRAYENGNERENVKQATIALINRSDNDQGAMKSLATVDRYKSSWCQQFNALMWRSWIQNLREPMLVPVRAMQTIVIALLLGLVYYDTKLEGSTGVQNVTGLLFLFISNMTFQYAFAVVNVFCEELPIFMREHFSGVYRADTYYLTKIISELPQYIIFPFLFTVILYFMAGLDQNAIIFFTLCAINILSCNVAISFGYMISCIFDDVNIALSVAPAFIIPSMLFGGFYMNSGSIPVYFQWLQYVSYFKYSYEAAVINQFSHVTHIPGCGANGTCPENGTAVLQSLSIDPGTFSLDIIVLVIMIIIVRLISYLALLIRTYVRKD